MHFKLNFDLQKNCNFWKLCGGKKNLQILAPTFSHSIVALSEIILHQITLFSLSSICCALGSETSKLGLLIQNALLETGFWPPNQHLTHQDLFGKMGSISFFNFAQIFSWNNLYSGAKHIPLSSQRPFHFLCCYWRHFHCDQTNTMLIVLWICKMKKGHLMP